MELLFGVQGAALWVFQWIIPFIVVLSVVVVVHEWGHFIVGRLCGVKVDSFSVGFGPEIASYTDKKGTRWRVAALPLGGYVKFFGDMGPASNPDPEQLTHLEEAGVSKSEVFHYKPLYQRALIVAAGPFANFILAILIFAGIFMIVGERHLVPLIGEVVADSAAEEAGFTSGDLVVGLQGRSVSNFTEIQQVVAMNAEIELAFIVEREGQEVHLTATPRRVEVTDRFGNVQDIGRLGMGQDSDTTEMTIKRYGPFHAVWKGTVQTSDIVTQTFVYLGRVISGRESAEQLGGPLRIAQISGQVATSGPVALIYLIGILSVSIGLINLFPVPILDGGHLVFYGFEAVFGKPLGEGAQEFGFRVGLVLVLSLMVFATWNDLVHLQVFESLKGMFS